MRHQRQSRGVDAEMRLALNPVCEGVSKLVGEVAAVAGTGRADVVAAPVAKCVRDLHGVVAVVHEGL